MKFETIWRRWPSMAAALILSSVCLLGCHTPLPVGDIYVNVTSFTDWQRYHDRFQPEFKLSEEQALALAVPDTFQLESSILDSVSGAVRVKAAGGALENMDTQAAVDPTTVDPVADAGEAKVTEAEKILDRSQLKVDARLRYLVATALWQEVQMLNRYVVDAAIEEGYVPYILRLRVTNMPHNRQAAYGMRW